MVNQYAREGSRTAKKAHISILASNRKISSPSLTTQRFSCQSEHGISKVVLNSILSSIRNNEQNCCFSRKMKPKYPSGCPMIPSHSSDGARTIPSKRRGKIARDFCPFSFVLWNNKAFKRLTGKRSGQHRQHR